MKTIRKLFYITSLLTIGAAHAAPACDAFEITIKNNIADDLVVRNIQANGADLQPSGIQKIDKKSVQTFTINNSSENTPINCQLTLNTITLPSKEVKIEFTLENRGLICEHSDHSPVGDLSLDKHRLPNKVQYTVDN